MEELVKNGRPRQFPVCERYGAHRFSPKTKRCPCGYQRPGTVAEAKKQADTTKPVRISKALLDRLQKVSSGSVSQIVKLAIEEFLSFHETE
jgi:ribosomal protein L37E